MSEGNATSVDEQAIADAVADGADELAPGTTLLHGQYKITAFLNAGGFGITYRAHDSLERPVVIKECFPGAFCRRSRAIVQARSRAHKTEFASIVRHFVEEARSLSKLQHPNIVGVHQVFEENDTAYMALDFVEGRDLLDIVEDEDLSAALTPQQVEDILRAVLDAIGFVHAQDMLHRDISPDNILLRPDLTPVLIDFGAARQQPSGDSKVLSALRVVKDGYSPQEFYVTGSEQGPYSDLYALGASFYHVIAGEAPPDSQTRLSAIATGTGDPYKPLAGNVPGYPEPVLASIDRAMAVLPKDRVQSAAEWIALMDGKAPVAVAASSPAGQAAPAAAQMQAGSVEAPKKGKAGLLVGVAVVALAAAGIGAFSTGMIGGSDQIAAEEVGTPVATSSASETADPVAPTVDAVDASVETEAAASEVVDVEPETAGTTSTEEPSEEVSPSVETVVTELEDNTPDALVVEQADRSIVPVPRPNLPSGAQIDAPAFETVTTLEEPAVEDETTLEASLAEPNEVEELPSVRPTQRTPDLASELAEDLEAEFGSGQIARRIPAQPADEAGTDLILPSAPSAPSALAEGAVDVARLSVLPQTPAPSAQNVLASVLPDFTPLSLPASISTDVASPAPATLADPAVDARGWTRGVTIETTLPGTEILPEPEPEPEIEVAAPAVQGGDIIQTDWKVALPFADLRADEGGSLWIRSVEGVTVENEAAFNAALREMYDLGGVDEVTLVVGLGPAGGPVVVEQTITLPIAQETRLLNGMAFTSMPEDGRWVTRVIEAPTGSAADLQVGDVLFAHVSSGQEIDGRTSLAALLTSEILQGRGTHSFAVDRNGNRWLASLNYTPLAQN